MPPAVEPPCCEQVTGLAMIRTASCKAASRSATITRPSLSSTPWPRSATSEDHHPELMVSYKPLRGQLRHPFGQRRRAACRENDFICAAKVDALYVLAGRRMSGRPDRHHHRRPWPPLSGRQPTDASCNASRAARRPMSPWATSST